MRSRKENPKLGRRETEALQWAACGLRYKGIASAMGIKLCTVQEHLQRARLNLGARNTAHAVAIAWRQGLIS